MKIKKIVEPVILFVIMGGLYCGIEILWRGYTHWSMFVLAGICGVFVGSLNEHIEWTMPIWEQVLIGTGGALSLELIFGCIFNLWLGLGIWDYSNQPFNILGQVCLPFAFIWAGLITVTIILDDYLRYWLFGEERPFYFFKSKKRGCRNELHNKEE